MDRQPDSVAGAVNEVLRESGLGQHIAGCGVDLFGRHSGTHRRHRSSLGALQDRVLRGYLG